jgi:hypothetical protein
MTEPLDLRTFGSLDPGIRDIVAHLRAAGFETTDSGDGKTKDPSDPEVLPFAHVAIQSRPNLLFTDAEAAHAFLGAASVPPGFKVEATYDPEDKTAMLLITWPGSL